MPDHRDLELLASGRDADVYALDGSRVLRRYRAGGDVAAEAAVMAYVAGFGFPVPAVYEAAGPDLVLERLDGATLLAAMIAADVDVATGAELLADLHHRLHALPTRPGAGAGSRVLHLDLHPDNVMLTSRGPVVIDWRNASDGPPALEVALSALIVAQVAVDETNERSALARAFLPEFCRRTDDPKLMLDQAAAMRAADPNMSPDETARLAAAAALVRDQRG